MTKNDRSRTGLKMVPVFVPDVPTAQTLSPSDKLRHIQYENPTDLTLLVVLVLLFHFFFTHPPGNPFLTQVNQVNYRLEKHKSKWKIFCDSHRDFYNNCPISILQQLESLT
jgi:hypothetical protein